MIETAIPTMTIEQGGTKTKAQEVRNACYSKRQKVEGSPNETSFIAMNEN